MVAGASPGSVARVVDHQSHELSAAMLVTGFPGLGLVGTIATNYLAQALNLERIASLVYDELPPIAVVRGGQAMSPVRVHSGPMICGLDGKCDQLAVVLSEVLVRPEDIFPLAKAILEWSRGKKVREVLTLEGIRSEATDEREPKLYGLANREAGLRRLKDMGIPVFPEGNLVGFSGVAMYLGETMGMDVTCLLVETRQDFPDARGAARVLQTINPMIPHIPIDAAPLLKQAELIEDQIRSSLDRHRVALDGISEQSRIMYG